MGEVKKFLSAAEILAAQDMQVVEVEVPEWGGVVRLRPMTAEEGLKLGTSGGDKRHSAVKVVVMTAVDADGKQLFTESDLEKLQGKSLSALMKIQKRALEINGLADEKGTAVKND